MQSSNSTAIGIVVGGAFIAAALFYGGAAARNLPTTNHAAGIIPEAEAAFRAPTSSDHVVGNPDAPIAIVEYSDFECPFCARPHPTLSRIVSENSDVKWVFRHFPLSTIHARALSSAIASECIAQLGGNDAFWAFTDNAFANQRQLSDGWHEEQARSFGIDPNAFESCTNDQSVAAKIQVDVEEATSAGGRGTPYVIVVSPSGRLFPFSGALPYEQIAGVVDQARNN